MCVSIISEIVSAAVCLDCSMAVLVAQMQVFQRARQRELGAFGDAVGAFVQLPEGARHRGSGVEARVVDQARDLVALVHHGLGEDEALGLDRLDGLVGDAPDLVGEALALAY